MSGRQDSSGRTVPWWREVWMDVQDNPLEGVQLALLLAYVVVTGVTVYGTFVLGWK